MIDYSTGQKKPKSLHHRKLAFRSVDRGRPQGARAHWASIKSSTLVIVRYIKLTENEYSMIDTIIRFSKRLFKSHFISLSDLGCFRRKSDLSWGGIVEIGISAIAFIQQPPWIRIPPQKHKGVRPHPLRRFGLWWPLRPGDPTLSNMAIIFRGTQMSANEYSLNDVIHHIYFLDLRRDSVRISVESSGLVSNHFFHWLSSKTLKMAFPPCLFLPRRQTISDFLITHLNHRIFLCGHLYASANDRYGRFPRIPRLKRHQHPPKRLQRMAARPLGEILNRDG